MSDSTTMSPETARRILALVPFDRRFPVGQFRPPSGVVPGFVRGFAELEFVLMPQKRSLPGVHMERLADWIENEVGDAAAAADVRDAAAYAKGHVPGAVNMSVKELFTPDNLATIPPDGDVVVATLALGRERATGEPVADAFWSQTEPTATTFSRQAGAVMPSLCVPPSRTIFFFSSHYNNRSSKFTLKSPLTLDFQSPTAGRIGLCHSCTISPSAVFSRPPGKASLTT